MTQKKTFTFHISNDMKAALQKIRARDGISEAEQIRRGVQMWLDSQGVKVKTERPGSVKPRKRS